MKNDVNARERIKELLMYAKKIKVFRMIKMLKERNGQKKIKGEI